MPSSKHIFPHQTEAEEAILGALLLDRAALVLIQDSLPQEAFYRTAHQLIYRAIVTLYQGGHALDLIAVVEYLQEREQLDQVGGAYQLVELTHRVGSSANIEQHTKMVMAAYRRRQLLLWAHATIEQAYRADKDALALLETTCEELMELSNYGNGSTMLQLLNSAVVNLEQLSKQENGTAGVPTGFTNLDVCIGGWQASDLIILAARPSMGKTALALQLAHHAAQAGFSVAFFSLEMSALQLTTRVIKQQAGINNQTLLTEEGRAKIRTYAPILKNLPLYIDDTAGLSITQLRARCKKLHAQGKLQLLIIDYLQLMTAAADPHQQREQEVAAISRGLKGLAKELNVPVIALSQLSRACEKRDNKRPQLSDLRESGSVEQDADLVVFLSRLEQYGILEDEEGNSTKGKAEVIVAKFRNGATGVLGLEWEGGFMRFGG